jgi:hypothetical protein
MNFFVVSNGSSTVTATATESILPVYKFPTSVQKISLQRKKNE